MPITDQQKELLLQTLRQKFPSWNSFDDADFVAEEIAYKQVAAQKAQQLLGKETLQNLLAAGNYDEILQNLATIGKSTNLLYLNIPSSGDLGILYKDDLDKESFSRAIFYLLWGEGDSPTRLKHYLDYVTANSLPNKWTFPTYFLFLCHPQTDLFIKPYGATRPFLKLIGSEFVLPEKPNADSYAALLQLAQEIKEAFSEYEPRNLVHIQSLMWVCAHATGQHSMDFQSTDEEKPAVEIPSITLQTRFWKIAPGENAHLWNQCRSGNYIAIGWPSMGDVRTVRRAEFEAKREIAVQEDSDVTRDGVEQLWKFAREVKIGDRIVANQGFSKVAGIGVVTGPCEYVEGIHYRHRLPVNWYDSTPRQVEQKGWLRTMVDLKRETFDAVVNAPALEETKYWKFAPYSTCWDWDICKTSGVAILGYDGLGDISGMHPKEFRQLRDDLQSQNTQFSKSDIDAVFTLTQLSPGDSIVAVERDTRRVLGYGEVAGVYFFDENAPQFKHRLPVQWHDIAQNRQDDSSRRKTLEEITENNFTNLTGKEIVSVPQKPQMLETPRPQQTAMKSYPLNQILYGPPGTGKTFNTINRAVEIIDGIAPADRTECVARFEELREAKQIGFVTFHQSFSYEEFIEGLRPVVDDEREGAHYTVRDGILKELALRALGNMLEPLGPAPQGRTAFESVWEALLGQIEAEPNREIIGLSESSSYRLTVSAKGDVQGINTKSGMPSIYRCPRSDAEEVWQSYRDSIAVNSAEVKAKVGNSQHFFIAAVINEMKRMEKTAHHSQIVLPPTDEAQRARSYLDNRGSFKLKSTEQKARYVLIIDEINRGNISKIFGELITLLEPDKRLGKTNALRVILPYSGDTFALPPNLYLIGTMNTADKSLALLDIALRRRFTFKEIRPDFHICAGLTAEMRAVLIELNKRIMLVLDREHRLGHSFFIGVQSPQDFNAVFADKIVPLLQEYFYNDWDGLRSVLGEKENGSIVGTMLQIDGVKGRNRYAWWHDLDQPTPDFFAVLCKNFGIGNISANSASDAVATETDNA